MINGYQENKWRWNKLVSTFIPFHNFGNLVYKISLIYFSLHKFIILSYVVRNVMNLIKLLWNKDWASPKLLAVRIRVKNKRNRRTSLRRARQELLLASHGKRWAGPRARGSTTRNTAAACGPPPRPSAGSSSCSARSSLPTPPPAHPPPPPPRDPSGSAPWLLPCMKRTLRPWSAGSRRRSTAPGTRDRQVSAPPTPASPFLAIACSLSLNCDDARLVFVGMPIAERSAVRWQVECFRVPGVVDQ